MMNVGELRSQEVGDTSTSSELLGKTQALACGKFRGNFWGTFLWLLHFAVKQSLIKTALWNSDNFF